MAAAPEPPRVAADDLLRRYSARIRKVVASAALAASLLLFSASILWLLVRYVPLFSLAKDVGYGDSYVMYDVMRFQRTGVIYRDLAAPPYVPCSYSPLTYLVHSIPGKVISTEDPFTGPRVVSFVSFFLCIAMAVSITRKLVPDRRAIFWAVLLGASISCMYEWVLQIRGDFPGIFFNLAAVRLLLAGGPWGIAAAGICAGLATQFKFSFIAALAAGFLWLLLRRQWKELTTFTVAGLFASAGLYLLYSVREPRMWSHLTSLNVSVSWISGAACDRHLERYSSPRRCSRWSVSQW